MTDIDWDLLWAEARSAARYTSRDNRWHDDCISVAAKTLHENWYRPPSFRRWLARNAAVDEHRRLCGRSDRQRRTSLVPLEGNNDYRSWAERTGTWDEYPSETHGLTVEEIIDLCCCDDPSNIQIARGVAEGRPKQDIAADLKVTPAAVSHRLRTMRERARRLTA